MMDIYLKTGKTGLIDVAHYSCVWSSPDYDAALDSSKVIRHNMH